MSVDSVYVCLQLLSGREGVSTRRHPRRPGGPDKAPGMYSRWRYASVTVLASQRAGEWTPDTSQCGAAVNWDKPHYMCDLRIQNKSQFLKCVLEGVL